MNQEFKNKITCILLEKFLQEHSLDELTVERIRVIQISSKMLTEDSDSNKGDTPKIDLDDLLDNYGILTRSLYWQNIVKVRDLLKLSDFELKKMRGVGPITYRRIKEFLERNNLKLKGQ